MKNKRILYFALLSLVIFFIFDRAVFLLFNHVSNGFYQKPQQGFAAEKVSREVKNYYDTLILGSSRTRQGIHPWYLYKQLGLKAIKNARAGHYLKYNYYYYKLFKEKYKIPEYVIYGYDYFIFRLKSSERKLSILRGTGQKKPVDLKRVSTASLLNAVRNPSLLLKHKEQINTFWIDLLDRWSKKDKIIESSDLITSFRGEKTTIPKHHLKEPVKWKKKNYVRYPGHEGKYLGLLFSELKADNVKVFIVILPDFISVYRTNFEREAFFRETESIFAKYPNVTVLNYYSPEKFDIENPRLFRDGKYGKTNSHLSFWGAKILNRLLCNDIRKAIRKEK